ncbi:hypothetical protein BOX15_Mlig019406g3 [Macrostomum lignano]|uniref:Uncharacterized protein n=1 Tax=Macrostomum lignano TaxID=282301 RepID=A0A267DA00_9PLAT|nr:hypothetical protein BOX15_Mlig019406g1 [Macrostomum lignano]PAA91160.1 hypothetical protein BOX15_Mlig019406g3 [Macrostomum lignano]
MRGINQSAIMASNEDRQSRDSGSGARSEAQTDATESATLIGSEPTVVQSNDVEISTPTSATPKRRAGSKMYRGHSWRKCWSAVHRAQRRRVGLSNKSTTTASASLSNSQPPLASTDSSQTAATFAGLPSYLARVDTNVSADDLAGQAESSPTVQSDAATAEAAPSEPSSAEAVSTNQVAEQPGEDAAAASQGVETPFANLEIGHPVHQDLAGDSAETTKSMLANVIEKAILDFCSSRTVETMRRMFAGVTSELEATQGDAGRSGDKSTLTPHPVTGELVKEGIVIGSMDVFAPRVHKEYRLEMKDSLVEGFLKDVGVFRAICYRTKCQLEVTRRLLNKKLCTGGRWVKYLIVRIVGPSLRAINSCDCLLQKAVPAFKSRIEYRKPAFCRMFFREDIPDNANLYYNMQRTGGSSNRYGSLKLETPYRITSDRTIGSCPWKSGALKIGKLSFRGSGGHLCMRQVYPGYGYIDSTPVTSACKGVEALERIEKMHAEFLTSRQQLLLDRRTMTLPICR